MEKRKSSRKSGFTIMEVIIAVAIVGILTGVLVVNVVRIAKQAYLTRANDSAEVVYMAMQSAVTDLKTQGKFDELFSDEFLGEPSYNPGVEENPNAKFYAVPDAVLDGSGALNIPGATNPIGDNLTAEEIQELKDKKSLVYLTLKKDGSASEASGQFLKELLDPYIADKSVFNYSILIELNRSNKTVRAAFYSEKTPELKYVQRVPNESLKTDPADVYFRERSLLDEKKQGYFGTLAVGERENVQKLDNAYVKIYNDDMLTVEWGEFVPQSAGDWAAKKKILPGMTYDVYLVNAVDTTEVYYKIEGVTPYKEQAEYITIDGGSPNVSPVHPGSGDEFTGNVQYGTTRMPVYDLFSWDHISYAVDTKLKATSFKTYRYGTGSQEEMPAAGHRLSYCPGTENRSTGEGEPGKFRLVLDSITEAGYDSLSISQTYPDLPWDANFKVIVEGKYHGEGFTGSMNMSQEVANAYTAGKSLYSQDGSGNEILPESKRGMNALKEFIQYVKNRLTGSGADDNYWWHEISYARHLNNMRYIMGHNEDSEEKKQGKYQNFLLTDDIDWSLQKIGRTENSDGSLVHRLMVANTVSENLRDPSADNLKVFAPLSTGETIKDDGSSGFAGLFRSDTETPDGKPDPKPDQKPDPMPEPEPYSIFNLKLAKNVASDNANYDITRITPDESADYVGLFEEVSSEGELSYLTLNGISLLGHDYSGSIAGTFYGKAVYLTVLNNQDTREMKLAQQSSGSSDWSESVQGTFRPWNFGSGSWSGNNGRVLGNSYVGGLFGKAAKKDSSNAADWGKLKDLANGTIYVNQYEAGAASLNGIAVTAKSSYAGGIAGELTEEVIVNKVVNTGNVTADSYAGGIAGRIGKNVRLDGADAEDPYERYLVSRKTQTNYGTEVYKTAEYQNYGKVAAVANTTSAAAGSYAGGIVGIATNEDSGIFGIGRGKFPVLSNLRNAGYVVADETHAGGIAARIETASLYNVQNASDVHAKTEYAGGIVGEAVKESQIEGAQNLRSESWNTGSYTTQNGAGVRLYWSKMDSTIMGGVSSEQYAGGIAGAVKDKTQINPLSFVKPVNTDDKFVPTNTDRNVYNSKELPLLVKLTEIEGLVQTTTTSVPGTAEIMPLVNDAQVTGVGKEVTDHNGSAPLGTSFYIGGIAGAVTDTATLNQYSENTAAGWGWDVKVPMRNEGNITAIKGSYAGGIAGAATGEAEIYNAENGQRQNSQKQSDVVVQAVSYAGGIAGAIASEKQVGISEDTTVKTTTTKVKLFNSAKLNGGSSDEYYTNRAKQILTEKFCAGGIAGSVETEIPVMNFYNGGNVKAVDREAGGLFGAAGGRTKTEYDFDALSARMKRGTEKPYGTNAGKIEAGAMAGGIAGGVSHEDVQLRDVFNTGEVRTLTGGDYAGGIIGFVKVTNPGVDNDNGIIRHSKRVIEEIIAASNTSYGSRQYPVYTNTGHVYAAGSYAGGIVGWGSVSMVDVFNAGEITANVSHAGGIAGELAYADTPGEAITLSTTAESSSAFNVVGKMIKNAVDRYDREFSLYNNRGNVSTQSKSCAGGIVGAVVSDLESGQREITVSDMYNAGHVAAGLTNTADWNVIKDSDRFGDGAPVSSLAGADSISAGGIIGFAQGTTLKYPDTSAVLVISEQEDRNWEEKLVPNMGNILAMSEAGGLVGSAKGDKNVTDVQVINGMNRGVIRTQEESAGGLVGEGIWLTICTNQAVAEEALAHMDNPERDLFTNHGKVIAGTNNAGGIAGLLENAMIQDTFNRGEIRANSNNAGGIIGYARNSDDKLVMEISHSQEIAEGMLPDKNTGSNTGDENYTFTNTASVTAGGNNAGGIAGKAVGSVGKQNDYYADLDTDKKVGKVVFLDVYSGDPSTKGASEAANGSEAVKIEAGNNAGGMVGRFVDAVIVNEYTAEIALSNGIYTNNAQVTTARDNAGGIVGNADTREGSISDTPKDTRDYSTTPSVMKTEVDSNHFLIADVYNIGKITAKGYNGGGIFGIAAAGAYNNDPELVKTAVNTGGMLTNKGEVKAKNNAGGIFGAVTAKLDTNELEAAKNQNDEVKTSHILLPATYKTEADVLDVFNGGKVTATSNNAGGIAGAAVHLDLRYSEATLRDTINAGDPANNVPVSADTFLAVNTEMVTAGSSNAGGIIGYGYQCILQDVFNTGTESLKKALEDTEYRIVAGTDNAGGIIGHADGMKLFYSDIICRNIREDRNYVYSNVANVKAERGNNAGGIAGVAENSIELLDAYNMGAVKAGRDNAGGLAGYLKQPTTFDTNKEPVTIAFPASDPDPFKAISIENNTTIVRSTDNTVDFYRGEDYITFGKPVSYITYTTIVTGTDDKYKTGEKDSFDNDIYTNRYTSMAKPAVTSAHEYGYHIVAGRNRAGGIVGYAQSTDPNKYDPDMDLMAPEKAALRIENVFSTGSLANPEIGGVWAKGNERDNDDPANPNTSDAGGIIGRAEYAHLTYSFDMNPGPDNLDVGGKDLNDYPNSKGDHSVMTEAFNDPRVMKDPYAIDIDKVGKVGLHMVANSARVRANKYGPNETYSYGDGTVYLSNGEFINLHSKNAGGAIGTMRGGRAERLYSLKGEVVTPTNLGGVVGYATDHALIRQTSRMGVYNKDKFETLEKNRIYNIYSYRDKTGELVKTDLDGVDITAGTETVNPDTADQVKTRGSLNVGGIVGYADKNSQILDTRNLVNVEGRAYVGGIIGQAGENVEVTLAHNMQKVTGKVNSPEDAAHKDDLLTVDQMTGRYLDRSAVDGCYIGGIVGKTFDTAKQDGIRKPKTPTVITMAKNDPLLTQNFEDRLAEIYEGREKDIYGGNSVNAIDGRKYVGGITGAHGVVNYAVNTGQLTGVQYIGGVSGQGYRITNSFNTADINAENNYLYIGNEKPVFSQAVYVGGIAGQIGHRDANVKLQTAELGSYIKNSYNASAKVNGASIVGGIAGDAIAPVDTTYNSAIVATVQTNLGNSGSESAETGNKVGGLVGQVAQDTDDIIKIIDSYNSGIVGGTGDTGGILGYVEHYGDGEIINSTEDDRRKRIDNSYFIKDSSVRYYNVLSAQVSNDINATLRALNLDAQYPIEQFMYETATASDLKGEMVVDSDYGARNYSNMIYNEYKEYRDLIVSTVGGSASGGRLTGNEDLQSPLNEGKNLNWQTSDVIQPSKANMNDVGAAKFVFPYVDSSGSGNTIMLGRDYEFPHLDFSGKNGDNKAGMAKIQLDPNTDELERSNQWFVSEDNTRPSVLFNVWPTKVIDYMQVDVSYDDGGSAEDAVYDATGHLIRPGSKKAELAASQPYTLSTGTQIPKWQVNYNYTGTTGTVDNHVPTSVFTPETLTLTGRFSDKDVLPRIMKFNIYDGYSRGDYSYDNAQFTVKRVENQIQRSYVMVHEDEWKATASASNADAQPSHKEVDFRGKKYYFYIESNADVESIPNINTVDIMELIKVSLQEVTTGGVPEIEWKIVLPSIEMDTYLAAKSGFFTAEAVKVYDEADHIVRDDYKTWERTSRMFSMHFANYYSSKDPGNQNYVTGKLNPDHNRGIYDEYPELDLDAFDEGKMTKEYPVEDTAALGSVKLEIKTATASNATASNADADDAEVGDYVEKVTNRLQIANERHLYNMNKNQNQNDGQEKIDSYLPYVNRGIQLIRDIRLSTTDKGYNCFIIGLSKSSFKRMTGSLDGQDLDGNLHTIGNLQVDMKYASHNLPKDLPEESYGLIYDLSGGVVKNLRIGSDSRIRAKLTGALAFQASNGKSGEDVLNNPWYENRGPELPIEAGSDAKIYNTRVNADITGEQVGGYVYQTVRRFESSDETKPSVKKELTDALTITNSQFGGKINTVKKSTTEDYYIDRSLLSAGFLCRMLGKYDANNLLQSSASGNYPQNAYVNGCEVTEDAYIYGKEYAAGIVGAVNNLTDAQVAVVRKSANNGTVVSTKRASGISQGIMEDAGEELDKSGVDVLYSYNNGIVQTPEDSGLSSGIGNVIRKAAYATNNGSVIGRIASGISNYGAKNMKILQCANNGYVRGKQIAGGIVAAPARWVGGAEQRALPYRSEGLSLKLSNCYNAGTVVVTTNVDNSRRDGAGTIDVIYNSYAGGIIGMAVLYDRYVDWFKTNDLYYLSSIDEADKRKTVISKCYNAGQVYYEENGSFSLNHRYVGGIAGGGLHRFVDIQKCYNLSDAEAAAGTRATVYRAAVDLNSYKSTATPDNWKQQVVSVLPDGAKYNYSLTAVGDMPYGENVATMTFSDMLNLENFVGFDNTWTVDHETADVNGYIYPFPQFAMTDKMRGKQYVGDDYPADQAVPDAVYNVDINKEKFHVDVTEAADAIQIAAVTDKKLIPATITYHEEEAKGKLGPFDRVDATESNAHEVDVLSESRYSINLQNSSSNYEVYVYDGDADAVEYTPAMIRRYEVQNGVVTSGGKLHDEKSTLESTMQYFNTAPGGAEYAAATDKILTIGDKEEVGWYMPIRGYYTVVVAERIGSGADVSTAGQYNDRITELASERTTALPKGSATRGGIKAEETASSSERFQIHFSEKSIEERGLTTEYKSGSKEKPYEVTDQYSIIGMTTSGIAQNATDRRYYKQIRDIVITEHAYPMFEFNGMYDAKKKAGKALMDHPVMDENYTISYQTDKGDFGFINYLAPTRDAKDKNFVPTISNLNILVKAEGEYSNKLGRYLEAANYTTALGIVADYAEYAEINGVTTLGNAVYKNVDSTSYRSGYFGGGKVAFGGVTGIVKNTDIIRTKNNATLGAELTPVNDVEVEGIKVSWTKHAGPEKCIQVAGITAVALSDRKAGHPGKMEYVFNNGEIRATFQEDAAGIAHTVHDVNIHYTGNGGWIRAMWGTAAGLVHTTDSDLQDGYNSGLVSAGAVKDNALGNAVGLFWNGTHGRIKRLYNAGVVRGNKQGAITKGLGKEATSLENVYYLKDEDLYWIDSSSLPDDMKIKKHGEDQKEPDKNQVELYLGFAYVPVEVYGFANDEPAVKDAAASGTSGPYDGGDPFALSYAELKDATAMALKGFGSTNWKILNPVVGPEADGTFFRDYRDDTYPLPQLKDYAHLTRRHLGFPIFLGGSKDVAKVPYENKGDIVKYIPFDYEAGDRDENFKDTIAVDLNDFSTTARYHVVVYEGDPGESKDSDGVSQYDPTKKTPALDISIQRRYVDTRDMTFETSTGLSETITPGAVGNSLNKEYGQLRSNERGAYFYEVNALDRSGKERPAVFEVKEFLDDNKVDLIFNNDILDELREPGIAGSPTDGKPYYTVTIVESQVALKGEATNTSNYYSKFSPHFANATAKQSEGWNYGTKDKPYEIATQRNLYNIAKGTDATAYLGNHYSQTQDIRLSAKKTDAVIANAAVDVKGNLLSLQVSQGKDGSAGSTVEQATVLKRQEDRKEFWTEAIGAVKPGTTEAGFRGTYTAKIASPSNADPGGYALVDTRTDIKSSIFGRVSPEAEISDVSYELAPVRVSSTERPVNEATVAKGVKALLVEENLGTVNNIKFAKAEGDTAKTLNLEPGAKLFALAVGETSWDGTAAQAPVVNRVVVEDGYLLKPKSTYSVNADSMTLAGVVGRVSGEASIKELESAAAIELPAGSDPRSRKDTIGMLIGEINGISSNLNKPDEIVLTNLAMTGSLDVQVLAQGKTIGGLIGKVQNNVKVSVTDATAGKKPEEPLPGEPEERLLQMQLSSPRNNYTTSTDSAVMGGIIGSVKDGSVILKNTGSYLNIKTNNANSNIVGGMIGSVDGSESDWTRPVTEVTIASDSNAGVLLEDNQSKDSVLGGVIGRVSGRSEVGIKGISTGSAEDIQNDKYGIAITAPAGGTTYPLYLGTERIAGGIIGKVQGFKQGNIMMMPEIEMADVTNRLSIQAEDSKGYYDYYLGGLIGQSKEGILYLHDTDPLETSNLQNEGTIFVENKHEKQNKIYAAGGIGYIEDSPAKVFAFRNNGDVTVSADENRRDYHQSNVHLAGVLAYAEGELEGIEVDDATGRWILSKALSVEESLNTGEVLDHRKMEFIPEESESVAGGIIATLEGGAGKADTEHPLQVAYNHNAGDVQALRAAGILTEMSDDWKAAIEKSDSETEIKTPVDLKYNLNINPVTAWYEEEAGEEGDAPKKITTGSGITLVYELPLAEIDGKEVDGYEIAETLAELATPSVATPSVASPSVASPSVASPSIAYYNATLEDMVEAADKNSVPANPILPTDRIDGAQLSLAELQSLQLFLEATKWNNPDVIDDEAASGVKPPKWVMTEGRGPGITQNRYIPPEGRSRLATAVQLITVDQVLMSMTKRTWKLELVEQPEDDLEGELSIASASNASRSSATPSNASRSAATPSNAQEKYQMVETAETVAADGYELSWEYSGVIPEEGATATDSNAEPAEDPEYEFAVVWDVYGVRYTMKTGLLKPDSDGIWHYTVTPEMIAEMTELLPYEDGILEAQVSIAVLVDDRMYRGTPWTVFLEKTSDAETFAERAVLQWNLNEELADYPDAVQYLVNYGLSRKGNPYSQALAGYGDYVDCSYLVMDTYRQIGIDLPRTAAAQAQYLESSGLTIPDGDLEPGDLIYYSFENNGRYKNISHVAMYIGNGTIVDASSSRGEVVSRGMMGLNSVVTCARPLAMN